MSLKKKNIRLRWRIVMVLLLVSLMPLGLVGIGSWIVFGKLLEKKTLDLHRNVIQSHSRSIGLYLSERIRALNLVARSHRLEEVCDQNKLLVLLGTLNDAYGESFIDLGIIDKEGKHLAYVGPYDLLDKNYASERWFNDVIVQGSYVSDVFLGFRRVPHCVIAVKRQDDSRSWILRATINSDEFDKLVQTGQLGGTGDAFLVNTEGFYQTPPKFGKVLERSAITSPERHRGVRVSRVIEQESTKLRSSTWLNDNRWMLVVQQDEAEIKAPLSRAMHLGILVILFAVVLVVFTTVLATWHLTDRIDRANAQRDALSRDLLRSAKLASLGEMSTGLAHEINNPLAIISAEQTNIGDYAIDLDSSASGREEILKAVERCKRQIERCGNITAKMLQFGRKSEVKLQMTDIAPRLEEIVHLMNKHAEVNNIELKLAIESGIPRLLIDPTELEQALVNLVNNALYATKGGGQIKVSARQRNQEVLVEVIDDGKGIAPEDLDRIFQPFFTTKPPGKGTGLGLSVCYGIVRDWGGTIEARSVLGKGTIMSLRLPVPKENMSHGN